MTRRYFSGGTSGELLPSGEFVINVKNVGLITHLGTVGFPPGEYAGLLWPRCTIVGGFKFAGQCNSTVSKAAERVNGHWISRDDLPYPSTNWPVIYDRAGQLHCNPVNAAGSQGYRYVTPDNIIISGDATYGPFNDLSEWTDLGDGLYVGQASDAYAAVLYDANRGVRLLLESGYRRFIVANRDGDTVTISLSDQSGVIFLQTTMSELRALPVFAPAPVPVPVPPAPQPAPTPEPSVPAFDPTQDQATSSWTDAQLRQAIDLELRAANSSDDGGYWFTAIRQHPTPVTQADWFYWVGRIKTGDGAGKGYPGGGVTPTPPVPPSPDPGLAQLQAEIDAITARLAALENKPASAGGNFAIKSSRGRYLRDDWSDSVGKFDRTTADVGETYTLEPK